MNDKRKQAEALEKQLDEALEETFPASDPVSLVQPGVKPRRRPLPKPAPDEEGEATDAAQRREREGGADEPPENTKP
ncbi:MAG: hypothetical protein WD226_02905 [Planctomycetota bacterium]